MKNKWKNKRTWVRSEENLLLLLIHFSIVLLYVNQQMTHIASASTVSPPSDCGWPSIDEITCDYYGCCWKSTNSSTIGCFNATNDTTTTTMLPTTTMTTTTATTTTTLQTTTTVVPTTTAPTTMVNTTVVQTTGPVTTITQQATTPSSTQSKSAMTTGHNSSSPASLPTEPPSSPINSETSVTVEATSEASSLLTGSTAEETPPPPPSSSSSSSSDTDTASQTTAIPATMVAATDTAATTTTSIDEQRTTAGSADSTTASSFTVACVPEWNNFTNQFILQGTRYREFSTSVDDCLNGCSDLIMDCVVANVFIASDNSVSCLLHSNTNNLANRFSSSQANVYYLQKRCIYDRTTVAAESVMTASSDCTAAAWLNTTGTCFNGALFFLEYKSVDACLTACSCYVSGCIAAFVRNATADEGGGGGGGEIQCYMNKRSDSLADLWSCPSVTQYVVLGSQGLSSAVPYSLYPVTTEPGPTTETLVDYSICWHPPEAQKADVALYKDAYGLVAIYTCRQGYSFAYGGTSRTSVCQGNQWINKVPGCEPVVCDTSGFSLDPTYALSPDSLNSGQVLSSSCPANADRFIDGSAQETLKCTTASGRRGLLQKQPSACRGGRCVAPPLITNTTALYYGFRRLLALSCIPGHRFPDGKSQQNSACNTDGSWPLISPCQAIFCPVLPPLASGSYSTDQVIYGTTVTARCKTGCMFPDHNLTRTFNCIDGAGLDAEWDDQRADKCQVVTCTNPPTPVTGECTWNLSTPTTASTFYYLDAIQYDCLGGRKFSDGVKSKAVVCSANGYWSADEVSCDYNRCDPVPEVDQATPSTLKALKGITVDYTCDLGYWFKRNKTVESSTCDGVSWSSVDAQCTEVTCPDLTKTVTNAKINGTDNTYDASVEIDCLPGHLFNEQQTMTINCTVTGDWSINITCEPVDCGPTESVMNAIVTLSMTSTTFGSNVTYECIDGFWFGRNTSSITATCDVSAQWSVNAVAGVDHWRHCNPITCLPLATSHVVNTTDVALETAVNVSCQDGQRFATSKANDIEAICSDIGTWQPAIPDCINRDPTQKVRLQVTEAKQSGVIAGVAIAVVVVAVAVLVFFDWSRLRAAVTLLAKNANASCGR